VKTWFKFIGFLVFTLFMFALGFGWRDLQTGSLPKVKAVTTLLGVTPGGKSLAPVDRFQQTFKKIQGEYVRPLDSKKLKYAALGGLVASLGDPHTIFLEPKEAKDFALETKANFVGVGARLSPDPLGAKVVVVFEDSPAMRSGLKAGDTITAVDGRPTVGKDIDTIVSTIRGEPGSLVRLTVMRTGEAKPIDITCKRAQIITPTVESKLLEGTTIGYLGISSFAQPTAEQFIRNVKKLETQGITGLIVDLRENPGGLLETAKDMLSYFVENKVVVKMSGRRGEEVVRTDSGLVHAWTYPVVVLVNENSASASEIFAGVLQDYRKTVLVGEHTYGKASVQQVIPLIDGPSLKVTTDRYYLPSGRYIGRKVDEDNEYISGGLTPDVKVSIDPSVDAVFGDPKSDPQLQKAMEVVKSKAN
jgi:carboxyl-terminal processing protease